MLLKAIIMSSLLVVVSAVGSQYFQLRLRGNKAIELRGKEWDLRRWLQAEIDCQATAEKFAATCEQGDSAGKVVGGYVSAVRKDGSDVIDRRDATIRAGGGDLASQDYAGRIHCLTVDGMTELRVETRRERDGKALKDPLTGTPETWTPISAAPLSCQSLPSIAGGGCVHVLHGGSAAIANSWNKIHGHLYSCAIDTNLAPLGSVAAPTSSRRLRVTFKWGSPPPSRTWGSPAMPIDWTDNALSTFSVGSGFSCDTLQETVIIDDLGASYYEEGNGLGGVGYTVGAVGRAEKYFLYQVQYSPVTRTVSIRSSGDGWGECRYTTACAACISDVLVEVIP